MPFKFNPLSGRFDLVESSSGTPLPVSDGGTGRSTLTDGAVLVGNGTSPITMIGPLTDGQLLIGSTVGIDPVPANLTSSNSSVTITNGSGSINLSVLRPLTNGQLLIGSTSNPPVLANITSVDASVTITNGPGTIDLSVGTQISGTGQTVGLTTANVITLPLGSTPGTYTLEARVAGFESSTPAGAGFQIFGTVRTTGAAAVLVDIPDIVDNLESAISTCLADIVVSGNTAIIKVTGVLLLTINWSSSLEYTFRG